MYNVRRVVYIRVLFILEIVIIEVFVYLGEVLLEVYVIDCGVIFDCG